MNKYPSVNVLDFLNNKGIEAKRTTGDWIKLKCPFHNDKTPSFYMDSSTGGWICFVCGTGGWRKFLELTGFEDDGINNQLVGIVEPVDWNRYKSRLYIKEDENEYCAPVPEGLELLEESNSEHKKFIDYLYSRDLIDIIGGVFCSRAKKDFNYGLKYRNRILIPVYNLEGDKILWFEGRYIGNNKKQKYYRPVGVNKNKILFNYSNIKDSDTVIVVEGILDCLKLISYGEKVVCSFGSHLSDEQIGLLSGFDEVVICLDMDKAGIKGFLNLKKKLLNTGTSLDRIYLPRNKDVCDISKKLFYILKDKRKQLV